MVHRGVKASFWGLPRSWETHLQMGWTPLKRRRREYSIPPPPAAGGCVAGSLVRRFNGLPRLICTLSPSFLSTNSASPWAYTPRPLRLTPPSPQRVVYGQRLAHAPISVPAGTGQVVPPWAWGKRGKSLPVTPPRHAPLSQSHRGVTEWDEQARLFG